MSNNDNISKVLDQLQFSNEEKRLFEEGIKIIKESQQEMAQNPEAIILSKIKELVENEV